MSYEHRSNRISMRSPQSAICHLRLRQGGEMELTLVDAGGVKFVEGTQNEAYLARARHRSRD